MRIDNTPVNIDAAAFAFCRDSWRQSICSQNISSRCYLTGHYPQADPRGHTPFRF